MPYDAKESARISGFKRKAILFLANNILIFRIGFLFFLCRILGHFRFYLRLRYDLYHIERFSFERRKVIGFAITMPHDWLKKLAPHFHPIRSKTKNQS